MGERARDEGLVLPGKAERALRYEFICKMGGPPEFRYCNGEWAKHVESVVIDDVPFAQGALRACHRMQIVNRDGTRTNVVAKVSKDPSVDRKTYYNDVQAQACAKQWAMEFNDHDIPKMIDFVTAYVFELVDRPGRPLIGAEEFIEGVFEKHNNNVGSTIGGVHEERATPNAFSHFTWEASNRSLLVCDIQGVGDMYTDPQIHTVSGKGFGLGNLGQAGLNAFLTRHKCNSICEHLGLSLINTKDGAMETRGTPCRGQPPGNLARTGSRHNLELGVSGNSIGIKPYGGCADSAEGGAGAGSEAVSLGKAEEAVSPTPVLMTAPSNRAFKKDEQRLQVSPAKLDKSDEGLMDEILNELDDL